MVRRHTEVTAADLMKWFAVDPVRSIDSCQQWVEDIVADDLRDQIAALPEDKQNRLREILDGNR